MRIDSVSLSWFRGAADPVALDLNGKSAVVYGTNGAGKSSFVDAVEYALSGGKVAHLAHEYSGRRQERAIVNTHRPPGGVTEVSVALRDGAQFRAEIAPDGAARISGGGEVGIASWDYRRTVLRQDEVAAFIRDTKGDKYSALLPLLGLRHLEVAAENLRQLAKALERESRLAENRSAAAAVATVRKAAFGLDDDGAIMARIGVLHARHCPHSAASVALDRCAEIKASLARRIAQYGADQRRHDALRAIAASAIREHVAAVRVAGMGLANDAEPLVQERLRVLEASAALADRLHPTGPVDCPACGRPLDAADLQAHVAAELGRLAVTIASFGRWKAAVGTLCDALTALRARASHPDVGPWREMLARDGRAGAFAFVDALDIDGVRARCGEPDLQAIEGAFLPLVESAAAGSADAPPDVAQIAAEGTLVDAAKTALGGADLAAAVRRGADLVAFASSLEAGVREEIRIRSAATVAAITADVQAMWAVLHPDEPIKDVRLYLPDLADKAIDIALTFHGVPQDSPRLTLSEGYRNSLGLCIFLAMAKRDEALDRPLFLDDVVVSLDRNHRGMIAGLLASHFAGRQVVVLTHDRDWYTELRHQLDEKDWSFKALLPYDAPGVGIRWSTKTTAFDDARAHLADRPDSAGTDARKIMDVELSIAAERLRLRLPYLRGDGNEMRVAHSFLERLTSDGAKCFQMAVERARAPGAPATAALEREYGPHAQAIEAFRVAAVLLASWANRASHRMEGIIRPEAIKVIDACETAVGAFKCPACNKCVWYADAAGPESVQCQCGKLRWRYGKG